MPSRFVANERGRILDALAVGYNERVKTEKKCYRCQRVLPTAEFHKNRSQWDGLQSYCKSCRAAYDSTDERLAKARENEARLRRANPEKYRAKGREWAARNPEKIRAKWLRQTYGISMETYQALLDKQRGLCAICNEPASPLSIDHDHSCCSGRRTCGNCIRGLLCRECNSAIGLFREDRRRIGNAIQYLSEYGLPA